MKVQDCKHIAIIGTGMIGTSFAVMFTGHGYKTTLYAMNDELAKKSEEQYDAFYRDLIEHNCLTAEDAAICKKYLNYTLDYNDIKDADFVCECAFEKLEVKHAIYKEVEKYIDDPLAIISTSSAMSPDDLVTGLTKFADRMIVAHPFFPPHVIPFVEVVRSAKTAPGVAEKAKEILESAGREVVILKKNAPGFLANRLQHALFREAMYIVQEGIADPRDVDKAAMYSFMPRYTKIGIFEHVDNSGVDLNYNIEEYLYDHLCNTGGVMPMIKELYDKGDYGVKTGKGVYDWSNVDMKDFQERIYEPYWSFFNWELPKE